jgi:hypothetical protein
MDVLPRMDEQRGRPDWGRLSLWLPLQRARHYQDLARRHPDEDMFWLCRASYFGRVSVAPTVAAATPTDRRRRWTQA